MKRSSWLDVLMSMSSVDDPLTPEMRKALVLLDEALFDFWHLGENIVLVWSREQDVLRFLGIPHYVILQAAQSAFMNSLLAGPKCLSSDEFDKTCDDAGRCGRMRYFENRIQPPCRTCSVDSLVTRYGVTLVRERAVVLLDAVGFSLHLAARASRDAEQPQLFGELGLQSAFLEGHPVNFGRTTTGDGFYIWNRSKTRDANIALYKLMMLLLADNAVAHKKAAKNFPVPILRAAFHIGEHYEFYQVEALNPTTFGYIVGPVTIDLARMLSKASADQILLGKFEVAMRDEQSVHGHVQVHRRDGGHAQRAERPCGRRRPHQEDTLLPDRSEGAERRFRGRVLRHQGQAWPESFRL